MIKTGMTVEGSKPWGLYTAIILIALMVIRVTALPISPVGLHGDEAQYWSWAQDLDWGYFSKPPLIAWLIALTTGMFGDAEWAVRISSPVLHSVTAGVLFLTSRRLWDARTGFWTAVIYILMPGVSLSSGLVSTDVPLLLCWVTALYGLTRLREAVSYKWAAVTGMAIGVGCLAKYAMLFFLPALIIAMLIDAPLRKALLSWAGLLIAVIAGVILAPNIAWNFNHDFATVTHTAANSSVTGLTLKPLNLLEFWGEQTGVFGPLTLIFYVLAAIAALKGKLAPHGRWLALFVLSPLILISLQALLNRANANWAVTTYIAGAILTARYVTVYFNLKWVRVLTVAGLALNIILGSYVLGGIVSPKFVDAVGQANAFKRLRGWPETRDAISDIAVKGHDGSAYTAIAFDSRLHYFDMNYYGLGETLPIKMWMHTAAAHNHAELTAPLPAGKGPVLLISHYDNYAQEFNEDFGRLIDMGEIAIELGGGKTRRLKVWAGYDYTPTTTR